MNELLRDKDWLLEKYQSLSPNQIAILVGVSGRTVCWWLKKHNIPTRSITESMLLQSNELSRKSKKYWADKKHREQHSNKLKSVQSKRKIELSKSAKKNWAINRAAMMAGMVIANTPEKKLKISKSVTKSFTPNRRSAQSDISKQLWSKPEYIVKRQQSLLVVMSSEEYRQKASENSKKLWADKNYRSKQATATSNLPTTSILEIIAISVLDNIYNIKSTQVALGPWTFDIGFEYEGRRILIECQGNYWHSRPERQLRDRQKHTYWERYLSQEYELHYIYEYEFYGINCIRDRIAKILAISPELFDFNFNNVEIRLVSSDESSIFFNQYHYLSKGRGGLKIGAFIGDKLIACASFNSITRKQSADRLKLPTTSILELDRFCIHPNYHKKNFASWFLARSTNLIPDNIKCLLSFADIGANHSGAI